MVKMAKMHEGRLDVDNRDEHGWFKKGAHSYTPLLRCKSVQLLSKSYPVSSRAGNLYQLKWFLDYNSLSPEEFLSLSAQEVKKVIIGACLTKNGEGKTSTRRMFYVVMRLLALNGRAVDFTRQERKTFLKRGMRKKIARQYIPTQEDIFRMADSFPNKGPLQMKRGKAIVLCLWQSGVRASCLCSWTWAMFKDKLYPTVQTPIPIRVVAERPEGVNDVAVDTKISAYDVSYYFTFVHEEAAKVLKSYLDERMKRGWQPKDEDRVFVTEAINRRGTPLKPVMLNEIVKSGAKQIGIDPDSIWTHCLRKAFRKTLYSSGVDPDIAEALMGHKLNASRGSYFDYHDLDFTKREYQRGFWGRINRDRVRELEESVAKVKTYEKRIEELEQKNQELKQRLNGHVLSTDQISELLKRIEKLEKQAQKQI